VPIISLLLNSLILLCSASLQHLAAEPLIENNSTLTSNSKQIAYHLSAGDKLRIQVFGEDDLKLDTLVGKDGKISYPFLGEINVNGLTTQQLKSTITKGLQGSYLINPEVNVSILEYRPFFIHGEVKAPGGYPYQPALSLRKAIALSGGVTTRASLELATLIKESDSSKIPVKIDLDTVINPGDIITIQAYKRIFVDGEVKKPGSFDFQPGLTLHKIISLAGGFTERAARDKIYIVRDANLSQKPMEANLSDAVFPGDSITIKQSFF